MANRRLPFNRSAKVSSPWLRLDILFLENRVILVDIEVGRGLDLDD